MTPSNIQEMFNIKVTPYDLRDHCRTVLSKTKTNKHDLNSLRYELMKGIASGTVCPCILKGQEELVFLKRRYVNGNQSFY